MKFLKLGLVASALMLFIIACSQTPGTNNSGGGNNTATAANSNQAMPPATANTAAATPADELAAARKIYTQTCANCHKEDGTGGLKDIDGKKVKVPNFASERMKKDSDAEFIEVIKNGETGEGMPAFKDKLSEEEIKNLVKFIRKEFQGK